MRMFRWESGALLTVRHSSIAFKEIKEVYMDYTRVCMFLEMIRRCVHKIGSTTVDIVYRSKRQKPGHKNFRTYFIL